MPASLLASTRSPRARGAQRPVARAFFKPQNSAWLAALVVALLAPLDQNSQGEAQRPTREDGLESCLEFVGHYLVALPGSPITTRRAPTRGLTRRARWELIVWARQSRAGRIG